MQDVLLVWLVNGRVRHYVHLLRCEVNVLRHDGGLPRALHDLRSLHRHEILTEDGALLRKHHAGAHTLQASRVAIVQVERLVDICGR